MPRTPQAVFGVPYRLIFTAPRGPAVPLLLNIPLAAAALGWNLSGDALPAWAVLGLLGAGVLLWTLLEYVLHAFAFHRPSRSRVLGFFRFLHGEHHDDPTDPAHIFTRPAFTLPVAALLWCVFRLALPGWRLAALPTAGVALGYLAYEVIHYAIHKAPTARWVRPLARHHLYHHYGAPDRCFGVSSPLWDVVFRTGRRRPARRAVPSP